MGDSKLQIVKCKLQIDSERRALAVGDGGPAEGETLRKSEVLAAAPHGNAAPWGRWPADVVRSLLGTALKAAGAGVAKLKS